MTAVVSKKSQLAVLQVAAFAILLMFSALVAPTTDSAAQTVARAASSADAHAFLDAIDQIARRSSPPREVIDDLVILGQDGDPSTRKYAIVALASIRAKPKLVVPLFIKALQDEEVSVRAAAASALGVLGHDAPEAVPALINAVRNSRKSESSGADYFAAMDSLLHLAEPQRIPFSYHWRGIKMPASNATPRVLAEHLLRQAEQTPFSRLFEGLPGHL